LLPILTIYFFPSAQTISANSILFTFEKVRLVTWNISKLSSFYWTHSSVKVIEENS
jgi:hypothetical protein